MSPKEYFDNNQKLVNFIFWKYFYNKIPSIWHEDVIQEGLLELWRVCNSYDESTNNTFSTYACICIKGRMNRFYRENISSVKIPRSMWDNGTAPSIHVTSLDEVICESDKSEITLADTIAAPPEYNEDSLLDTIEGFLETISCKNHRDIMEEYLYGELYFVAPSQQELSEKYKISQPQVSRILNKYKAKFGEYIQ